MKCKPETQYYFTPVRITVIKNTRNTKHHQGCGGKRTPAHLLVGMQIGTATMENIMEIPQKI